MPYSATEHESLVIGAGFLGVDVSNCNGGYRLIGYGDTKYGYGPACIVDLTGTSVVVEPHVTWFPWTRPKDRIANFLWAMQHLSQSAEVMLVVQKSQNTFFEHFVKKSILRKIGLINRIPELEEIHLYQYERNCHVEGS